MRDYRREVDEREHQSNAADNPDQLLQDGSGVSLNSHLGTPNIPTGNGVSGSEGC